MSRAAGTSRSAGLRHGAQSPRRTTAIDLPSEFFAAVRRHKRRLTRDVLLVSIKNQRMWHFVQEKAQAGTSAHQLQKQFTISTSRFGIGQQEGSYKTPLGLHRIARKIGRGQPVGTVFKGRKPIGTIAEIGRDNAMICHRILWLDGLEPGFNRGGNVDTFNRYIYIHGFGDESTLGHPQSHGCIHVGAEDLIPLYELLPRGTLVWIQR